MGSSRGVFWFVGEKIESECGRERAERAGGGFIYLSCLVKPYCNYLLAVTDNYTSSQTMKVIFSSRRTL